MKVGVIISCLLSVVYSRYSRRVPTGHSNSPNALSLLDVIPSKSGNNVEIETEASAKVDVCNALHEALEEGLLERVDVLLAAGADSICFNDYEVPVGHSIDSDASNLSEAMLSKSGNNVEIESENADVCKDLHDAVEEGLLARMESLLAVGVDANCLNEPPMLVTAVHSPDSDNKTDMAIVQLLLNQKGINVDAKTDEGLTALHRAVFTGDVDTVMILLDAEADVRSVDNNNSTALMMAITNPFNGNKSGLVEVLLEQTNTEVNAKDGEGFAALHYASLEGEVDIVKTLLDAGANINSVENNNYTALMKVITSPFTGNKKTVVLALLEHPNIEVNAKSDEGNTALHYAAFEGELHIVMTLLIAGAGVNSVGSNNYTSLMMAILSPYSDNKSDIVQILLIHPDIDVNAKSVDGFTAFHYATLEGDLEIVKILLKAGVDVNGVDNYNYTALMMAMLSPLIENRTDIVEVLLQQPNIDVYVETVEGYTALDFARRQGNMVTSLLLDAEMDNNMVTSLLDAADNKTAKMDNNMVISMLDAADNKTAEMDNNMVTSLLDAADNKTAEMDNMVTSLLDAADNKTAEVDNMVTSLLVMSLLDAADNKTAEMDNNMVTSLLDEAGNRTAEIDDNMVPSILDAAGNRTADMDNMVTSLFVMSLLDAADNTENEIDNNVVRSPLDAVDLTIAETDS